MEDLLNSSLKFLLFLFLSSLVIFVFVLYDINENSLNAFNRFQSGDTIVCDNSMQVNNKFYSLSSDGRYYLNKLDNSAFSKYDCK